MAQSHDATATPERDGGGPHRGTERRNLPARIALYYRQVVAELRKVIWPTRQELLTYTSVVIVFVLVIIAYIMGLDFVFAKLVLWVFA